MLGLDISSSSVKLVELGQDKSGNLVLERCAIEPLERGWITDGNIEKFDEVADGFAAFGGDHQEDCSPRRDVGPGTRSTG
jgi:Tfp pilus assembly PilM family ATPase